MTPTPTQKQAAEVAVCAAVKTKEGEIVLKQIKYQVEEVLGEHAIKSLGLDMEQTRERLTCRLTTQIWSEDLSTKKHVIAFTKPATWWDHFKQDLFPRWLLRRFPVKYLTETKVIESKWVAIYPKLGEEVMLQKKYVIKYLYNQL